MVEVPRHLLVGLVIRLREGVLRGVGEDDAKSEGRLQRVPLEHRYVVRGIRPLHLDCEVESGRPAAHHDDPHAAPSPPACFRSCPATMRCWISVVPSEIRSARTARYSRSTGWDASTPRPPRICTASSTIRWAASVAKAFAIAASRVTRSAPRSFSQAAR